MYPEKPSDLEDWKKAVKRHACRIRTIMGGQLWGWNINRDRDGELVAAFLKGVEEGRKNSEIVLKKILKKYNIDLEKVQ